MYRIGLLIGLLALCLQAGWTQQTRDFTYYDKTTYTLYETGDWSVLAMVGREALQAGYDYYYLRMRLGIAFYSLKQYRTALVHFEKALHFNQGDATALWYLYYSYRLGGMVPEAERLQKEHAVLRRDAELPGPQGFIYRIYTEGGVKVSSRQYQEYPVGNVYFGHAGLGHRFSPSLRLYHGYQYLQLNLGAWQDRNPGPGPGGGQQVFVKTPTRQQEYYAQLELVPARKIRVMPAYHFLYVDTDSLIENNHVASLGLAWEAAPWLRLEGAFSYSQIADEEHPQATVAAILYPLGNNSLYFMVRGMGIREAGATGYLLYLKPGFRLTPSTWLEGSYTLGNLRHVNEWNGFVVFNNPDDITGRWNITLYQGIGSRLQLNLNFQSESKKYYLDQSTYIHYGLWAGLNLDL